MNRKLIGITAGTMFLLSAFSTAHAATGSMVHNSPPAATGYYTDPRFPGQHFSGPSDPRLIADEKQYAAAHPAPPKTTTATSTVYSATVGHKKMYFHSKAARDVYLKWYYAQKK